MMRALLAAALALTLSACAAQRSTSPYASQTQPDRSPAEAERLALKAAGMMKSDPSSAEALLRQALVLDLFNGSAHNNLGVLCLNKGDLYQAAQEFEWARKLIPGSADPRINLALALERAGHTDEALDAYAAALEVMPESVPAMQGVSCLEVRSGHSDPKLDQRLQTIALRGETEEWREWARAQLSKRGGSEGGATDPPR